MNKTILLLSILCNSLVFTGCETKSEKISESVSSPKTLDYETLNKEKTETSNKAQIKITSFLKEDVKTKDELEVILKEIYEENKNEGSYKNFSEPTVVAAYLFTSEKLAKEDPSAWIGMLMKGPNDAEPRISINDMKLNSLSGLNDDVKSKDEIKLDNLNKYLSERNLELCSFHKKLADIELESIRKADKKFPDYGGGHDEYADKLLESEYAKLKKTHKLDDSIFMQVNVFSLGYCK